MATPVKFGTEFLVNTTTLNAQTEPSITALANGRFVVVFTDTSLSPDDDEIAAVRAQIFNADGSKFGAEFLVNTTTVRDQVDPAITTLSDGRFVITFRDESQSPDDTSASSVRAQIFNADGSKSGPEFLVNTTTFADQTYPSITSLANGRFVIAHSDWSGVAGNSGVAVRAQIFNADGSKSGAEFLVNTTTENYQWVQDMAGLDDGRFVVVFQDLSASPDDPSAHAVRAQIFNANGSKSGSEFLVNTTTASDQFRPTVTGLSGGGFVVAFTDNDSGSIDDPAGSAVRGQVFDANGNKAGSEFLVNTSTSGDQKSPNVAALNDGRFVVAFFNSSRAAGDTSGSAVRAQVFNADGSKSGSEFLVNTSTTGNQLDPDIAVLADGRFVISFEDVSKGTGDPSLEAVRGQIFDAREAAINITGTAGSDDFVGTGFRDRLKGLLGDDRLAGAGGNDTLDGGGGFDRIGGGDGKDKIFGGDDRDLLDGDAGNDNMQAGSGNDGLAGGRGADRLTGGDGNDRFTYLSRNDGGDIVIDFSNIAGNADKFVFENKAFGNLAEGNLSAAAFQSSDSNTASTADVRFFFETDTAILRYDADGNGAGAAIVIATLQAGAVLDIGGILIV